MRGRELKPCERCVGEVDREEGCEVECSACEAGVVRLDNSSASSSPAQRCRWERMAASSSSCRYRPQRKGQNHAAAAERGRDKAGDDKKTLCCCNCCGGCCSSLRKRRALALSARLFDSLRLLGGRCSASFSSSPAPSPSSSSSSVALSFSPSTARLLRRFTATVDGGPTSRDTR